MSETELIAQTEKTFEDIKHINENGNEYWYARELQIALHYSEWRKFEGVIEKAKDACRNSNINSLEHFVCSLQNGFIFLAIIIQLCYNS